LDSVKPVTQTPYLMLLALLSEERTLKAQRVLQDQLLSTARHNLAKMISIQGMDRKIKSLELSPIANDLCCLVGS